MTLVNQKGYHETAYLSDTGYLGGTITDVNAMQFNVVIADKKQVNGEQFNATATSNLKRGEQFRAVNVQKRTLGEQFNATATNKRLTAEQFKVFQAARRGLTAEQFNRAFHFWKSTGGYLSSDAYLQDPGGYVSGRNITFFGEQFLVNNANRRRIAEQFRLLNTAQTVKSGRQFRVLNTKQRKFGLQFTVNNAIRYGGQFRVAVYNTNGLRILAEFPSRGTEAQAGNNWTSTSTAAGDFSPNNVNSDILEKYWRSVTGVVSNVQLVCDTGLPQGAFVDTVGVLGHNFSGGASIFVEGSNSPTFATAGVSFNIRREAENSYYISPGLPLIGYRYWRFTFTDVGNADGFLKVGTIVFGSALIFAGECFTDVVKLGRKQYTDSVFTEGFTNVKNNRAQRKNLQLEFQSLNYTKNNYRILRSIAETYGTIHKCLWIPIPEYPSRFAVWGKLTELPTESHNDRGETNDYVSLSVSIDEAE